MSDTDRDKWNTRYREGAYLDRREPSEFVRRVCADRAVAPGARALDVACGAGRNALFLARCGYRVDALDISDVALARLARDAAAEKLDVHTLATDLVDSPRIPHTGYAVIVMIRFVAPRLLATLPERLAGGGVLVVEQHLQTDADVVGPGDRFRVASGELEATLTGCSVPLAVVDCSEGIVTDPDGRAVALSRIACERL